VNLTRSDVASLLTAGAMAPSVQDTRPWRLNWMDGAVEVRGDAGRALTVADPDARELRLACGSAVANVHLALRAQGWRAHTSLLPDPAEPWFYARVRPGSAWPSEPWERNLATGIRHRRADRPALLLPDPVRPRDRHEMLRAAERARCWMVYIDEPDDRRRLRDAKATARGRQGADPSFLLERDRWSGHHDADDPDRPQDDRDEEATFAVVATLADGCRSQLQAGRAMQEVLLTGTTRGLAASFVPSLLDGPGLRAAVRTMVGGGLWPQAVLGLGYPTARPAPARRLAISRG
jgi:hypothetical protein